MSSTSSSNTITGIAGYNSGLPVDDIIAKLISVEQKPITLMQNRRTTYNTQKGLYSSVQTKVSDLLTSIKKLTTRNVDGTSIFDAMAGASSDEKVATVSATGLASPQTISLEVKTLPSRTVATSTAGVGRFDVNNTLGELGITAGTFMVYADGTPYSINVATTDTIGNVLSAINTAVPDNIVSADPTIVDGKIQVAYNGAGQVRFGSGGDTSNFLSITNMLTAVDNGAGTITASQRNTTIDRNQLVSSGAANLATAVTDGTFVLNGVTFDTTGKTLNDIIYDINNSTANVTATFNKGNNTFQLSAKDTGSAYIHMEDGTGNFLTAMKLINGGDTTSSQTAGKNTEFVVNGATLYTTSTTVDETVTGLTGVTINLKQAQPGTTVQLTVRRDTDGLKTAVKDVIDKYNTAVAYIDQQTDAQNKMPLSGESRLKSFRSQLRGLFASAVGALGGTSYDSLQQIGITTGDVGSSAGKATPKLQLNESKLTAALNADFSTVKKLFIGQDLTGALNNTANDDNMEGVFTRVFHLLSDQTYTDTGGNTSFGVLYAGSGDDEKGLFAAYQSGVDKRISSLNDSIQRSQDRLATKEKTLRQQFLAMDRLVGQYQSQGAALTSLINQLSAK